MPLKLIHADTKALQAAASKALEFARNVDHTRPAGIQKGSVRRRGRVPEWNDRADELSFKSIGVAMSNVDTELLCLDGDCGLRKSAELVAEMQKKLATQDEVVIDATAAAAADVSTVQILVSAHKSALAAGKKLRVHVPLRGALGEVLVKGGFVAADGGALTPGEAPWVFEPPAKSGEAA